MITRSHGLGLDSASHVKRSLGVSVSQLPLHQPSPDTTTPFVNSAAPADAQQDSIDEPPRPLLADAALLLN